MQTTWNDASVGELIPVAPKRGIAQPSLVAAAFLLACGAPSAERHAAPPPQRTQAEASALTQSPPEAPLVLSSAPVPSEVPGAEVAPAATAVSETTSPVTTEETPSAADTQNTPTSLAAAPVDTRSWTEAHGVTGRVPAGECTEILLGVPLSPGLACRSDDTSGGLRTRLYRVEGKRLHEVWSAVSAMSWVELVPEIREEGAQLFLHDDGCEGAYCEAIAKYEQHASPWSMVKAVVQTCQSRGAFVWQKNRYVRAKSDEPPPLTRQRLAPNVLGECR